MVPLRGAEADAIRIEFQIDDLRQRQSRRHQEAEIVLTERERERSLLKKLCVYRPKVEWIDGDHYFFRCSLDQLEQYFRRLGGKCRVIKADKLRQRLVKYYQKKKKCSWIFRNLSFELSGPSFILFQITSFLKIKPMPSVSIMAKREGINLRLLFTYVSPRLSQTDPVGFKMRCTSINKEAQERR